MAPENDAEGDLKEIIKGLEEEIVVTEDGPRVITLFPSQELVVANPY